MATLVPFPAKNFSLYLLTFGQFNMLLAFNQLDWIILCRCAYTSANVYCFDYTTFRRFFKRFNAFRKPCLLCRPLLIGHVARHGVGLAGFGVSRPAFGDIVHIVKIRRCCTSAPRVKRRSSHAYSVFRHGVYLADKLCAQVTCLAVERFNNDVLFNVKVFKAVFLYIKVYK